MRALGESTDGETTVSGTSAAHLPWLSPGAASLAALARSPAAVAWSQIRSDPGAVLLVLAHAGDAVTDFPRVLSNPAILDEALRRLEHAGVGYVDWSRPAVLPVYRSSLVLARLAERLAKLSMRCDPEGAWVAGLLTPLASMAGCAVGATSPSSDNDASMVRRLCRRWHLPRWLSAVIGRLDLDAESAQSLGADIDLFRMVQLAVSLGQQHGLPLRPAVGAPAAVNLAALALPPEQLGGLDRAIASWMAEDLSTTTWQSPAFAPLLRDLLELAAEHRRQVDLPVIENLEADTDKLHQALRAQRQTEEARLQSLKLSALAEFAAGAGHEINNPLAVISGQAQYLLAQEPDPSRQRALQKIIDQAQRIHQILTELMQFARPPRPQPQSIDAGDVMREVAAGLTDVAAQRQVQLVCPLPEVPVLLHLDPRQARTALAALLRNAIEAAPADGWAGVRVEAGVEHVDFVVEDNGPGITPAQREHLFDPFYSGRQAGRGRGLGLPIAWQLARVNRGQVRCDSMESPTRFVLSFPTPLSSLPPGNSITVAPPSQIVVSNGDEHWPEGNGQVSAASPNL